MKNAVGRINREIDQAVETVYELEDKIFEIIQSEKNKERRMKKNEESLHDI